MMKSENLKRLLYLALLVLTVCLILLLLNYLGFFQFMLTILLALIPVILAIFISFLLEPLIQFFIRRKITRVISVIITYMLFAILLGLLGWLMVPSIINQITTFLMNLPVILQNVSNFLNSLTSGLGTGFDFMKMLDGYIADYSIETISNIFGFITNIVNVSLAIGGAIFLSFDFHRFKDWIKNAIPSSVKKNIISFFDDWLTMIHRYVFGVLLDAIIIWGIASFTLWLIGMDYPLVFGLIIAIFDMVPIIGPYLGGVPAILVGLTYSFEFAIYVTAIVIGIQLIDGNFIQPYIVKNVIYIHPLENILGLSVMGALFGFWGMVISPLLIMAIKIIIKQVKESKREKEGEIIEMRQIHDE